MWNTVEELSFFLFQITSVDCYSFHFPLTLRFPSSSQIFLMHSLGDENQGSHRLMCVEVDEFFHPQDRSKDSSGMLVMNVNGREDRPQPLSGPGFSEHPQARWGAAKLVPLRAPN